MKFWYSVIVGTIIFALVYMAFPSKAFAETIASMPNQGGGKIVLTNEVCEMNGKTYSKLSRAYNYTSEGYGSEGCFFVEDETVVVVWNMSGTAKRMRYPAENFTIIKKGGTRI